MEVELPGDGEGAPLSFTIRPAVEADLPAVLSLLEAESLPTVGVADWLPHYLVAESGGSLVGAAGLEVRNGGALLRSVVVSPGHKRMGLGSMLVAGAIERARANRVPAVYLLTTTAENYFPRHGFEPTDRAAVPPDVRESVEFREACPETAAVMVLRLARSSPGS